MSNHFRELLKKVGSGIHTGKNLTRVESAEATKMMLLQEATPAQIGAFMIAHRIKRPTPVELAGMLDAYDELGPHFSSEELPDSKTIAVFGNPYDGRTRNASVMPIIALILAAAGVPVLMHGGDTMPTKHGLPSVEIWQGLGVDFTTFSWEQMTELMAKTGLGFVYLPHHFLLAQNLVPYRDQIGKRPPFATLELIWSPCPKNSHFFAGFVHPPTEERLCETFALREVKNFTTIKGLEGSCELPLSRTAIIGLGQPDGTFERLLLHPQDYGFPHQDVPLESPHQLIANLQQVLQGKPSDLTSAAIYNSGFYLWRWGICADLATGFARAEEMLVGGQVADRLEQTISAIRELQ